MEAFAAVTALPFWLVLVFVGALGSMIGSFLNVVIHRLPRDESLVRPASHCPSCEQPVAWYDNVPVLAYLWLGGRCRRCGEAISLRYPAIELGVALLFVGIALRHGLQPMTVVWFAFGAALVAAAAIDFDHQIIPDEISLGGLGLALVAVPLVHALGGMPLWEAGARTVLGALVGAGPIWLLGFLHARITTLMGREFDHWPGPGESLPRPDSLDYWVWFPGVGFGDVKLLAMIGAVLGPFGVLTTLLLASVAGLLLGLAWALVTRSMAAPFGFGPAIALGALVVLFVPDLLARLLASG